MSEASAPAELSEITIVPRDIANTVEEIKSAELETPPNPRQQRKIIAFLSSVDPMPNFFRAYDVPINSNEHDSFLKKLRGDEIPQEKINKMLASVASPMDRRPADVQEIAKMQQNLTNNRQGRAFIAHILGKGMDQRDQITEADVVKFYENHPLPSTLEHEHKNKFLDELEKANGANGAVKRSEYEKSITLMMRDIYGKRMQYWEQFKLLDKEAKAGKMNLPQ